jgi:hypothetical protein
MSREVKDEFENISGGWIGIQVHDEGRRTGFKGVGLAPGARIWLDEEEQIATANKPRNEKDNPFANGQLKKTASGQEIGSRRPIGANMPVEEPSPAPEAPAAEQPVEEEEEMSEREKAEHNRKAAAERAVPAAGQPAPSTTEQRQKAPTPPEQVATPEATAAAGQAEQGQRAASERVGTPGAQEK